MMTATKTTTSSTFSYSRPWLYKKQHAAFFNKARYSFIEASTKSGKSHGGLAYLFERAILGKRGWNYWWVAPIMAQSRIMFRRLKRAVPQEVYTANDTEMTVTLANGAVIWFKGSDNPDSLYGEDVYDAVIDEASRCFVAGTLVDTPNGPIPIEHLQVGDSVLTAIGEGTVERVSEKETSEIAVVTVEGCDIISSSDHRYLTQRGWVEARRLTKHDRVIDRNTAMRVVQEYIQNHPTKSESKVLQPNVSVCSEESSDRNPVVCMVRQRLYGEYIEATDSSFLFAELFSEVENAAIFRSREGLYTGTLGEGSSQFETVLVAGHGTDTPNEEALSRIETDAQRIVPNQSLKDFEDDESSPKTAWREWDRSYQTSENVTERASQHICSGVFNQDRQTENKRWIPAILFDRHSRTNNEDCSRNRREFTSGENSSRSRSAQGRIFEGKRVDRVQVFQSGDSEFAQYSGGNDTVTVHDLEISGHPSFIVNGCVAHNCKEEAYYAVRSTLTATGGSLRCIGNVRGRQNWFYRECRRAQSNQFPGAEFHRITADDAVAAGVFPQSELDDAKAAFASNIEGFQQLYYAEAADDGGNPFGEESIRACVAELSNKPPTAFGIDLAKSRDWTVIIGLDEDGATCRFYRFQRSWEETVDDIIDIIGTVPTKVDSTGVGDPVLEQLQSRIPTETVEGLKFTAPSKQQLMHGLRLAISQRKVTYPEGPILEELLVFEYEHTPHGVRYTAPRGMHDDCVMALALAVSIAIAPKPAFFMEYI